MGGTFNQEKALVGFFSVIVKTDGSFAALCHGVMAREEPRWSGAARSGASPGTWLCLQLIVGRGGAGRGGRGGAADAGNCL